MRGDITDLLLSDFHCRNFLDDFPLKRRRAGPVHLVQQLRDDGVEAAPPPRVVAGVAVHLEAREHLNVGWAAAAVLHVDHGRDVVEQLLQQRALVGVVSGSSEDLRPETLKLRISNWASRQRRRHLLLRPRPHVDRRPRVPGPRPAGVHGLRDVVKEVA